MSRTYEADECPIKVSVSNKELSVTDDTEWGTYLHLDELSEPYPSNCCVYIFNDGENQVRETLKDKISQLERDYIHVQGVVFPCWMRDYVDELTDKQFYHVVQYGMFNELTEEIVQEVQQQIDIDNNNE